MKRFTFILLALGASLGALSAEPKNTAPVKDIRIVMVTDQGEIHATLYASKTPITVANFLNLAKRGYYNGNHFHRVIPNFMAQGGDPTETGRGGPGYRFDDEIVSSLKHNNPGTFSMANAGPGTNGSQFFITHRPTAHLDGRHTVFGNVTKGLVVVKKLTGKLSGRGWKTDGKGSEILEIKVLDDTAPLFKAQAARIAEWDKVLDQRAPRK
ncbi:peptidylprolyl isomerase [Rubritalea marina]|uniref:peptidylprolyl isomerase n=1 Tax=Rubritalea marina TaxID=361055 RepID=UPI000365038D|nr:peptidylprolyl isomerase [Rubritalea marina]